MHRPALMKLALGVGMLTMLMLALTACGGGSSVGSSSAQEEEKANKVHTIPEDAQTYEGEPLLARRYATDEFKPAMSFTLEKGWTRGGPEQRDIWDLRDIENENLDFWVVFTNAEEVYDPKGSERVKIAPPPEDMVGWLQANPHLKSEEPKPTSVGGEKGVQFDALVTGAVETPLCPGCSDLPLFRLSDGESTGPDQGQKVRFIVLEDVKGETVTIFVTSLASGFEESLSKAQKVIDSVKWTSS